MSKELPIQSSPRTHPTPDVLRRQVIEKLERLPDEGIAVLHDLAAELELRIAWAEFSAGMSADWANGKYEQLDLALKDARQALRKSRG